MPEDRAMPLRPPMIGPESAEEDFPEDISALEVRLDELGEEEKLWNAYIKELSALENPARGVFYATELHEARQYRMVVKYRRDFCLARLKRLNGVM